MLDRKICSVAVLSTALFVGAQAQVNGKIDSGEYGSALALQQNPTGFGDSNTGAVDLANGSELDGAYGKISGGNLYIMLTGNLETNFNKLDIFIDSGVGGQNTLSGTSGQGNQNKFEGMTFDTGFGANFWLSLTGGGSPSTIFVDQAGLSGGTWTGNYLGSTGYGSNGALTGGGGPAGILATIDNSNVAGVDGAAVNNPGAVLTGAEIAVPLSVLGNPVGAIRVMAFVNGSGQDFMSNQFLGSLPVGTANLGNNGAGAFSGFNFNQYAGDQFFTVNAVPEPTTLIALGLGVLALRRRRQGK